MEHKLIQWILGVAIVYTIFILMWKYFWKDIDPPPKPKEKIRRRHNDDE